MKKQEKTEKTETERYMKKTERNQKSIQNVSKKVS